MGISLRSLLIIPWVIQIIGITAVVGYSSYRSSQHVVENLATELMAKTGDLITQNLDHYLQTAHAQNRAHLATLQSGAISLDNLDQLHRYLTLQLLENETATTFLLGTVEGQLRASHRVTPQDYGINTRLLPQEPPVELAILEPTQSPDSQLYSVNPLGNPGRYLQTISNQDVRHRSWFRLARETGRPGWSEVFQIGSTEHLAISAFMPVYEESSQRLAGVFAVNVSLQQLNDFLANLTFCRSGQAFIMQANGLLIANSTADPTYTVTKSAARESEIPLPPATTPQDVRFERIAAIDSLNPVIRNAALTIQQEPTELSTLQTPKDLQMQLTGDRYFLRITPYQDDYGLDWFIVTSVPQSALTSTLQEDLRRTIIWAELALLSVIGVGLWLTRRVTKPLAALHLATQSYMRGERPDQPQPTWIQEIETLRSALTAMMAQTDVQKQQIAEFHRDYARSLEAEIAARTQKLATTTAQLREAQRLAQVGSWEFEVATEQLIWSDEMFRLFDRDLPLGPPTVAEIYDLLTPVDRDALQQAVAQAIATGQPYSLEQCIMLPNGSCRYVVSRGEAQRNAQGQVVRLLGTAADITERKLAELAFAASEEKRRLALDLTHTGSWEFEIATGQATWSDSHYRLMGLVPGSVPANYATWRDRVHPEDLTITEQRFQTAIDNYTLLSVEYRVVHPNGQVRWVLTQGQAVYADDGTPLRMVGVMMDISDRKQAEAERDQAMLQLQQSEANYLAILEHQTELITRFKTDGTLLFVNQAFCEYYGVHREAVIGNPYHPLIYPADQVAIDQCLAGLSPTNATCSLEHRVIVQGQIRWMQWTNRAIFDEQGQLTEFQSVGRDIHDRKQAEQELQRLNAQLQALATTDSLTGVANRRQFLATLVQEWSRHQRQHHPLALIMLDIDHFKAFNDTYGHPAGDQCLRQIADLLKDCMRRPGDLVARYGGEEFMMLLPSTDESGAIAIGQHLQQQIADLALLHAASPTAPCITVSLGIVVVQMPTAMEYEAAIARVDQMLYAAKQTRNTYRVAVIDQP